MQRVAPPTGYTLTCFLLASGHVFIRHLIIMKHHFFLIALFLSGCLHPALSQTIDGIITDSNNSPLPYANIILLSLPDSTYVQGTVSQEDGRFHLDGSSDNRLLRISFMGV